MELARRNPLGAHKNNTQGLPNIWESKRFSVLETIEQENPLSTSLTTTHLRDTDKDKLYEIFKTINNILPLSCPITHEGNVCKSMSGATLQKDTLKH